jgi:annexin A7/11
MMDAAERDAVLLYEAIRGTGSKCDRALIGILCTRTSAQLFLIKQAYYTMFSETLENHISGVDTCAADFHKVLFHTHILLPLFSRCFGHEI